jgi:predicted aldo/keto reductase-like oxidoreductase
MEYRTLGLSGLRISAVGLGCMGMSHAYGAPADKCKITELLTDAVDMGYTFLTRPKCMVHRTGRMVRIVGKSVAVVPQPNCDSLKIRHIV